MTHCWSTSTTMRSLGIGLPYRSLNGRKRSLNVYAQSIFGHHDAGDAEAAGRPNEPLEPWLQLADRFLGPLIRPVYMYRGPGPGLTEETNGARLKFAWPVPPTWLPRHLISRNGSTELFKTNEIQFPYTNAIVAKASHSSRRLVKLIEIGAIQSLSQ